MQSGSFFEPLEGRRLLSAAITRTTGGGLVVTDDNGGNNVFIVEVSTGMVQVSVNFQDQGTFPANNVIVNGGNGGDTITFKGITVGATLRGGTGKDVLHAFSIGGVPITMDGGNGNDQVFDDEGPAIILAGNGNDSIFLNNLSQATIDGGNGPDGIFINIDPGDPLGLNSQTAVVQSTGKGSGTIDITTTQTPPFGPTTSFTMESTFINVTSVYVNGVRVA